MPLKKKENEKVPVSPREFSTRIPRGKSPLPWKKNLRAVIKNMGAFLRDNVSFMGRNAFYEAVF